MKAFEYAAPREEHEVVGLLSAEWGHTEILAGGTDLVGLMQKMIVTPERVVNIKEVASMRGLEADSLGVTIGALANLDDLLASPELDDYMAVKQAISGMNSMQLQAQATLGGELCTRPRCWYFRNGHGLLAERGRLIEQGDHRHHAIFGNAGPAKFVSASRIAPALIALDARLRIIGPGHEDETLLPLEFFYRTPRGEHEREHTLAPNQLITHILLPPADGVSSATYEVRQSVGPETPYASAAAALWIEGGVVRDARLVLGQVAPTPWVATEAARSLVGQIVGRETARWAADVAVQAATPLPGNRHKVQMARASVERAILLAAGLPIGGF
ncbi:MAG: FAD binding domain-containing protein [Pirellulales bacterium]|nr:FAD binding domain-containing protein [Pirellulales bacterium]